MSIACPHCGHRMSLRDPKPGRFQPKCGKCARRFRLTIADASSSPVVEPLDAAPAAETKSNPPTANAPTPASKTAADVAATIDAALDSPSPSNGPPQATMGAADATIDHVGSQATKAAPDNITQDIGATIDAPPAATRADGSPPSPGEATQVHTPTQFATPMAAGASPAAKPTPPAGKHSDRLGGYRILRELGRGAMGTVYLARQLSLDRNVALKTIQAHWANHPNVMARFTREAYAAAQLTHHNVVQIYDLGEDRGTPYFSMEFVRGMSLADLLERAGKLDARTAVGHTLQAARGLRFAHQQGMIHRDIKPANLMLDEHGVVKVADLGLVKAPEMLDLDDEADESAASSTLASVTADVTMMNSAMGTPAYMAPEQAENAAGVDHRADIYSLGCTLYALLAGRPPFDGATALEVITKQKTQPVPRIESIDASIPQPLAEIVMRMVAKQPDERFANLDEVIEQLERFLAADGSASVPNEEHVATLETAVAEFHRSPAGKLRGLLATAFVGGCFGFALLTLFWSFKISSGLLVMAVAATFGYFAITGVRERTTLFDKLRALLFTARWSDWAVGLCGALLLLVIAWVGNCLIAWTVFAIVGVALAAGFHLTIDAMVRRQRQPAIDRVESMLKSLRLRGLDEAKLREFVAQYGGANWEGLFEAIFGYEAKLAARETITSGRRRKFRAWRDPLIRGIDARLAVHRAAREQRHLQKVEQASLRAKGTDPAAAREQAEQLAAAMVEQASEVRRAPASAAPAAVDPKLAAAQKRARIKAMLADARSGKYSRHSRSSPLARTFGLAFSGKVRFLLGCLLLAGCVLWMKQNGWLSAEEVTSATMQAVRDRNLTEVTAVADGVVSDLATQQTDSSKSLALPLVGRLFDSFNTGVAGLLLIALSIFRGWRMSLFALPAAAIMVLGPSLGIPGVEALGGSHTTSLALGGAIGAVGLLLGRTKNDDEN